MPHLGNVALFTRAWIEISLINRIAEVKVVALFTRAWIEIAPKGESRSSQSVALFTRAWIEIVALRLITDS